jgi:hypothetical protein
MPILLEPTLMISIVFFLSFLVSDEATEQLFASYMELRNPPGGNVGNNGTRTISATPRQLESLIRTSEALAKMRYSSVVTRADAREAVRLLKVATQAAATDPRTGKIDMDMINTGRSTVDREMEESIYLGLKELFAEVRPIKMMCVRVLLLLAPHIVFVSSAVETAWPFVMYPDSSQRYPISQYLMMILSVLSNEWRRTALFNLTNADSQSL